MVRSYISKSGLPALVDSSNEKLVRAVEVQMLGPFHAQLHKLGMVHLEAHRQREPVSVRHEQLVSIPHRVVVEVGIAHMRGTHDRRDSRSLGGLQHGQRLVQVARTVVDAGKDMAMQIPHQALRPLPATGSLANPPRPPAGTGLPCAPRGARRPAVGTGVRVSACSAETSPSSFTRLPSLV